jgi:TorA maturation chaperone TorD
MGEKTMEVAAWYECTDQQFRGDFKDLPDHIGAEFDFLGRLCAEESGAVAAGDEALEQKWRNAQGRFLADHLLKWFDLFARRLRKNDCSGFYSAIVDIAEHFIESEKEELGVPVADIEPG